MTELKLTRENLYERLSPDTRKLLTLARQAGKVALASRNKGLQISKDIEYKGFVTSGDMNVDTFVHSAVRAMFPDAATLSEETQVDFTPQDFQEVVIADPIDGTRWYKDGGDIWSINLSLVKNGQLKSAVIVQPDLGITTFAEKGVGAYCQKNGKISQIRTNPETDLLKSKVGIGANFSSPAVQAEISELQKHVVLKSRGPYVLESSGYELTCMARGVAFSAYIHPHAKPWDKTAGMLIINEAGGVATGWPGRDEIFGNGIIAAANAELYPKIADLANKYVS